MKKFKIFILLIFMLIPLCFAACENQNKNTLSTPDNISVENGIITFNSVSEAEYYVLNINGLSFTLDTKHSNNVSIIDNKINYDANKIFTIGESYAIKIKATASEMEDSSYSNVISYKHTQVISVPENIKLNGTTLTWDLVKNASYYLVKIITPYNSTIFDKDGNILTGDDSETIAKADLTAYSFSYNTFNFNSLLTKAGKYNFYINAVYFDGSVYKESGYSNKITYTHNIQLKTPTNGIIAEDESGNLYLNSVIDQNSTAISISCNGFEKQVELNGVEPGLSLNNNILSINLKQLFSEIDFSIIKKYEFKLKCMAGNNSFYTDSNYSSLVVYEQTTVLKSPVAILNFSQQNNCYEISWECASLANVSKFNVFIATPSELKTYTLDKYITSMLISEQDFFAVFVQAVGSGNFLNSNYSNIETLNADQTLSDLTVTKNGYSSISWNSVSGAYYLIDFNNTYSTSTENYFELSNLNLTKTENTFNVTVLAHGYQPKKEALSFEYNPTLKTPTFTSSQGFTSANPYLLTFSPVENAIGYQVYFKTQNEVEFRKIETIYTSTAIDLTQYIIAESGNSNYSVKVKAIADSNSVYKDSGFSIAKDVSHTRVLDKPSNVKVTKTTSGSSSTYTLSFNPVDGADGYEILINYNRIYVSKSNSTLSVDISRSLATANHYEIKVRALPSAQTSNVLPSDYSIIEYDVNKQLGEVQNIKVSESNGTYTLSFNPVENAQKYRVRVVKLADSGYASFLEQIDLSANFEVEGSCDVSAYVQRQGEYYFYVTALAAENGYYGDSDESTTCGVVSKLESLIKPTQLSLSNESESTFTLNWTGCEYADYYLVKITDPNGFKYEENAYSTSININNYVSTQGLYSFEVSSMITPNSENSKSYINSAPASLLPEYYYYFEQAHDFKRHTMNIYGENFTNYITNVTSLKNLLWYNYLYEIDRDYELPVYFAFAEGDDADTSLKELLISFGEAACSGGLNWYNFEEDTKWIELTADNSSYTNSEILAYLCKRLIELYPELHILDKDNVSVTADQTNKHIFKLYYRNSLNIEKVDSNVERELTDYKNDFEYLADYLRRGETSGFEIDKRAGVPVETTEQLLHAVENNKKPLFYNNSSTAQTVAQIVYNNAKAVLRAITTTNMTDVEKATRIFDWLSYGYNINPYANKVKDGPDVKDATLAQYGTRQDYYLESIFYHLIKQEDGTFYFGNTMATSASLSKAFSLLCGIEGIQTVTINGTYNQESQDVRHTWNKVYLSTTSDNNAKNWFVVDIALSETTLYTSNLESSYTASAHTFFLVKDEFLTAMHGTKENTSITGLYSSFQANTYYNYYANSTFSLSEAEIKAVSLDVQQTAASFKYTKQYYQESILSYNKYRSSSFGNKDAYILNSIFYAKHVINTTNQSYFVFDFSFVGQVAGSNFYGSLDMSINNLISSIRSTYGLNIKLSKYKQAVYGDYATIVLIFENA